MQRQRATMWSKHTISLPSPCNNSHSARAHSEEGKIWVFFLVNIVAAERSVKAVPRTSHVQATQCYKEVAQWGVLVLVRHTAIDSTILPFLVEGVRTAFNRILPSMWGSRHHTEDTANHLTSQATQSGLYTHTPNPPPPYSITVPVHCSIGLWFYREDNRSEIGLLGVVGPVLLLKEVSAVACLYQRAQLGRGRDLWADTHIVVALLRRETRDNNSTAMQVYCNVGLGVLEL